MAIGYNAMTANTAGGTQNIAIGNYAMDAHTSGDKNTAVGYNALSTNTSSEGSSTAVGAERFGCLLVTASLITQHIGARCFRNSTQQATNNTAVWS